MNAKDQKGSKSSTLPIEAKDTDSIDHNKPFAQSNKKRKKDTIATTRFSTKKEVETLLLNIGIKSGMLLRSKKDTVGFKISENDQNKPIAQILPVEDEHGQKSFGFKGMDIKKGEVVLYLGIETWIFQKTSIYISFNVLLAECIITSCYMAIEDVSEEFIVDIQRTWNKL